MPEKKRKAAVLCGDRRNYYIAGILSEEGFEVFSYAVEGMENAAGKNAVELVSEADIVIAPIPFCTDGSCLHSAGDDKVSVSEFLRSIKAGQTVFGGGFGRKIKEELSERKINCCDYLDSDEIAVKNAVATAEGTIAEAILNSEGNLDGSRALLLGYGRCAKALCSRLTALGANTAVAVRNTGTVDHPKVFSLYHMEDALKEADVIFNTIPARILGKQHISCLKKDVLIIDIASYPGGIDFDCCREQKIKALFLPGIPGKYAPKASAAILAAYIRHCMDSKE